MAASKPCCRELRTWLRTNLGKGCLGALTSTDAKALDAAVHLVELYAYDSSLDVLKAFGLTVNQMQRGTQHLAFHAIAHIRNWEDRAVMWTEAGLGEIMPGWIGECAWEPGGSARR